MKARSDELCQRKRFKKGDETCLFYISYETSVLKSDPVTGTRGRTKAGRLVLAIERNKHEA